MIVNCATGVLARYYHRYAAYLASNGWAVFTYDYRGIGLSRLRDLRRVRAGWRDWGERDFEAVLGFARARDPDGVLAVVGHSIGGVVIGYARSARHVDRILTIGAQYAHWRDYAPGERERFHRRWHVLMPALVRRHGYFPGRRLGWLEDLPAGVAADFAARYPRLEQGAPRAARNALASFAAVRAPILALTATDDPLGTEAAVRRAGLFHRRPAAASPAGARRPRRRRDRPFRAVPRPLRRELLAADPGLAGRRGAMADASLPLRRRPLTALRNSGPVRRAAWRPAQVRGPRRGCPPCGPACRCRG